MEPETNPGLNWLPTKVRRPWHDWYINHLTQHWDTLLTTTKPKPSEHWTAEHTRKITYLAANTPHTILNHTTPEQWSTHLFLLVTSTPKPHPSRNIPNNISLWYTVTNNTRVDAYPIRHRNRPGYDRHHNRTETYAWYKRSGLNPQSDTQLQQRLTHKQLQPWLNHPHIWDLHTTNPTIKWAALTKTAELIT